MQALFVDNLTVIDFAYFHPERGIVGESLVLDVELFGELNDEGMLFDFSFVKKRIKSCVDALVDHKFLVARGYSNLQVIESPQQLTLNMTTQNGDQYCHISPHQAVYMLNSSCVTPENIALEINSEIKSILPSNVTKIELHLRQEQIEKNFYHYSHGLKKHYGDCQRIAHGHRSKIEVWENGQYSDGLSAQIANLWADIYIATEEDIDEELEIEGQPYYHFKYHANQGAFQLTLPKNRCFLLETDTTVELIAIFLADYLKLQNPNSEIKVKAYEGLDKGAIAIV
jgi:6-pyruvoyl-tetrahydropterin synthase